MLFYPESHVSRGKFFRLCLIQVQSVHRRGGGLFLQRLFDAAVPTSDLGDFVRHGLHRLHLRRAAEHRLRARETPPRIFSHRSGKWMKRKRKRKQKLDEEVKAETR